MNTDRSTAGRETLTELDAGLTAFQRRVNDEHSIRCMAIDELGRDNLDRMIDEHLQIDPYAGDPPSRRSDKEIDRVLSILDSIETSTTERGNH